MIMSENLLTSADLCPACAACGGSGLAQPPHKRRVAGKNAPDAKRTEER